MIFFEKEGDWMASENQTDLKRKETLKVKRHYPF